MSTALTTDAAPIVINLYNSMFGKWPEHPDAYATGCRITTGADTMAHADAVVFHVPTLGSIDGLHKRPGQLWVACSMESSVMCPRLHDEELMRRFDLTMTYERTSDVWMPYFGPGTVPAIRQPVTPRTASAPVVWLQANAHDRCGRVAFGAELMKHVWVDSYGTVLRNRSETIAPGFDARVDLYRGYKFTLALENSFAPDYVTEKLFEPLAAGSVPVYRGTEDVAQLAPAPDCFIDARGFGSAQELAAYLDHLDRNDDEYETWHAWRSRPLPATFLEHLDRLREPPLCRLAAAVDSSVPRGAAPGGR